MAAATAAQQSSRFQEQIDGLKAMVFEQVVAYESMVVLEDNTTQLRPVIRRCRIDGRNERSLIARGLNLEVQEWDSMIQKLEEAIRMHRRWEDDFKRIAAKYKHSAETMQQEKQALMGMFDHQTVQETASQRALARRRAPVEICGEPDRSVITAFNDRTRSFAIKGELKTATALSKVARVVNGMEELFLKGDSSAGTGCVVTRGYSSLDLGDDDQ